MKQKKNKNQKIAVDPEDGTKIYSPIGQRFSVGESLANMDFDPDTEPETTPDNGSFIG